MGPDNMFVLTPQRDESGANIVGLSMTYAQLPKFVAHFGIDQIEQKPAEEEPSPKQGWKTLGRYVKTCATIKQSVLAKLRLRIEGDLLKQFQGNSTAAEYIKAYFPSAREQRKLKKKWNKYLNKEGKKPKKDTDPKTRIANLVINFQTNFTKAWVDANKA